MRRTKVEALAKDLERTLHAGDPTSQYAVEVFEHGREKCCLIGNMSYDKFLGSFRCKTWDVMYNWILLKLSEAEELLDIDEVASGDNLADVTNDIEQLSISGFGYAPEITDEEFEKETIGYQARDLKQTGIDTLNEFIPVFENIFGTATLYEILSPFYEDLLCKLGTEHEVIGVIRR